MGTADRRKSALCISGSISMKISLHVINISSNVCPLPCISSVGLVQVPSELGRGLVRYLCHLAQMPVSALLSSVSKYVSATTGACLRR